MSSVERLSPSAMMIISMIGSGEWSPAKYGVTEDMAGEYRRVWRFCEDYAGTSGSPPESALLRSRYPEFPWVDVSADPTWAAQQLVEHHGSEQLRGLIRQAIDLLNESNLSEAAALMRSWVPPGRKMPGRDMFDILEAGKEEQVPGYLLPWDSLSRVVGGLLPGDLWYVSGRPGDGKSWTLTAMVAHLLLHHEVRVRYFSLEMPARDMARRVLIAMTTGARQARRLLAGNDADIAAVIADVRSRAKGTLSVVDPSSGTCDPAAVADAAHASDVVVVDHMGLLRTASGGRVVDDWRAMHAVSNELKEIALATGTVVLAASQLNRSSEGVRETTTAHLSQSDALGQDADVVVALRRPVPTVAAYSVVKNRRGPSTRWWTSFSPGGGLFGEISKEAADAAAAEA